MSKYKNTSNLDVVHSGLVLISDGKGRGKLSKLLLTKEQLYIQVPVDPNNETALINTHNQQSPTTENTEPNVRVITVRKKGTVLGISIKGGVDEMASLPIVISKIMANTPADECMQLFIGDVILEINGVSLEQKSHDEAVRMLRESETSVTLTVKNCPQIAPILKQACGKAFHSTNDIFSEPMPFKSVLKSSISTNDIKTYTNSRPNINEPFLENEAKDGFKTICKLPLPMAIISRYLWGTDKIRNNAFELRTVDGKTSNIIHCEDRKALDQWVKQIQTHINNLNHKSTKISNKFLHTSEKILYIGWLDEIMPETFCDDVQIRWCNRFVILKGTDFCVFDSPPLNSEDLNKCLFLYKTTETAFKTAVPKRDRRDHVLAIDTACGSSHYFSFNSYAQFQQFENAYYDAVYKSIKAMQCKTFACSHLGRPSGLVIDYQQGISLYDIPTKQYIWSFKFHELDSSSDDGKMRLHMVFKNMRGENGPCLETKNIECDQVMNLVINKIVTNSSSIFDIDIDYPSDDDFIHLPETEKGEAVCIEQFEEVPIKPLIAERAQQIESIFSLFIFDNLLPFYQGYDEFNRLDNKVKEVEVLALPYKYQFKNTEHKVILIGNIKSINIFTSLRALIRQEKNISLVIRDLINDPNCLVLELLDLIGCYKKIKFHYSSKHEFETVYKRCVNHKSTEIEPTRCLEDFNHKTYVTDNEDCSNLTEDHSYAHLASDIRQNTLEKIKAIAKNNELFFSS
uniref:PDZ domain-containing protein n=1 Tax=Rhabditophanes sp. KR3021 TaxID=114890 RepID=A0AC35TZU1_9BILA